MKVFILLLFSISFFSSAHNFTPKEIRKKKNTLIQARENVKQLSRNEEIYCSSDQPYTSAENKKAYGDWREACLKSKDLILLKSQLKMAEADRDVIKQTRTHEYKRAKRTYDQAEKEARENYSRSVGVEITGGIGYCDFYQNEHTLRKYRKIEDIIKCRRASTINTKHCKDTFARHGFIYKCRSISSKFELNPARIRERSLQKTADFLRKRFYTLCAQSPSRGINDPDVIKTYNKYRKTCAGASELASQAYQALKEAQDEYNQATESQILPPTGGKTKVRRMSSGAGSVR